MIMGTTSKLTAEQHRKSTLYARLTYLTIITTFLTICTVAVLTMMKMEQEKTGFKAIQVTQPISFFDKTYLKKDAKPSKETPAKQP
jgi:hypothetical protein